MSTTTFRSMTMGPWSCAERREAEWLVPAQLNQSSPQRFVREDYAVIEEAAYRSEYLIGPHVLVVGFARK
jgi:hypothetical protein